MRKALVISVGDGKDLSDVVQIAKNEGKKIFGEVSVEDAFPTRGVNEYVVVFNIRNGVSERKMTNH